MKRILFILAAAGTILGAGCLDDRATGRSRGNGVVYRHHFAGVDSIMKGKEATTLKDILAMPVTADLRAAVLPQLARAPQEFWQKHLPAQSGDVSALTRPLLEDLYQQESWLEIRGPHNRLECALAIRLSEERARLWQTNLAQWAKAWKYGTPAAAQVEGWPGWQAKGPGVPGTVQWVRAREWLVLGIGFEKLPLSTGLLQSIQQTGRPVAGLTNNALLELEGDWARLGTWFPRFAKYRLPPTQMTVYARGENVRTEARFRDVGPLPTKLEPWRIPTNSIRDPLVGFTVGQGIGPLLSRVPGVTGMGLKPVPNQFCLWGIGNIAWETYLAVPVANASNAVQEIAPELPQVLLDAFGDLPGDFAWLTNRAEMRWQGLPFVAPTLSPLRSDGQDFLFFSLIPRLQYTNPAPQELFRQLANRDNLIYYDWEITQTRIEQVLQLHTLLDIIQRWQAPPNQVATRKWLVGVMPKLGNAITEVTISGPGELSLVRRSHIGFTGGELVMLCRWIENPGFPLRWEKPPPWQRVRGTNAPSAATNRPASSTGAKSAPKPQAKPANPVGTPAGQPRQGK